MDPITQAWTNALNNINTNSNLINVASAWELAVDFLKPRNLKGLNWNDRDHSGILAAFRLLKEVKLTEQLLKSFYHDVDTHFSLIDTDVARAIDRMEASPNEVGQVMFDLLERLVGWEKAWAAPLAAFEDRALRHDFYHRFLFTLHLHLPLSFSTHMNAYFLSTFHAFLQAADEPRFKPSPYIHRLGMMAKFGPEMMAVAYEEIRRKVEDECRGVWEDRKLDEVRMWAKSVVGGWWESLHQAEDDVEGLMKPIRTRLDHHVCKMMCELRTTELFDIIVNYPDTLPALEDLRECLSRTDSRSNLVQALHASNAKRLLHPGADTKDIIAQYISTIRCLRIVDPLGVLLQKVSSPIRSFLKDRPDTIRCIVSSLVDDEEGGEMEDAEGDIQPLQVTDELEEDYSDPNWQPAPIDAAPEFRSGKTSDIISTLVSIYDTQDEIVSELQVLLAQRLLAVKDYDLEKEIRTVEILKLRFGESALQACEVMLKDLADSKRIDQHVQSDAPSIIHPKIISRLFWPEFPSTGLKLPGQLARLQARYAKSFHRFKPDKRLRWIPQLGTVDVRLEMDDGRLVEVEASAVQAAVVESFTIASGEGWSTARVANRLEIPDEAVVLAALNFWAEHGVLSRDVHTGDWMVLERQAGGGGGGRMMEEG